MSSRTHLGNGLAYAVMVTLSLVLLHLSGSPGLLVALKNVNDLVIFRPLETRDLERAVERSDRMQRRHGELRFISAGSQDGRLWGSLQEAQRSTRVDASDSQGSAIRVGDLRGNLQYRSILSFDTSEIPDGAQILSAKLRLKRGGGSGTNPFLAHGICHVDVCRGGFGNHVELADDDFKASATAPRAGRLSDTAEDRSWAEATLDSDGRAAINKSGTTQFRLYFADGDGNNRYDFMGYYSGDSDLQDRPRLIVKFVLVGEIDPADSRQGTR